ncbi:hypothetical protein GQ43DRAFT_121113 [Delitschia confertaspora ATCC 74209]|uniref:Uncharacterized protein n=1 Tax=Delitschia confertaspora ATCC 74209 TaxID=1513339 RepID=A0A9P4JM36_9PLEO|nr:hypothetical protein GQ43DRAFT_121113 [Delitschia confertaspora ATCC 74209]
MYIYERFCSCYKLSKRQSYLLANPLMLHCHSLSLTQEPITQQKVNTSEKSGTMGHLETKISILGFQNWKIRHQSL